LFVPKSTPAAVVEKLYREVRKATDGPGVDSALAQEGVELNVNGPQALAEFLRLDIAKWRKVIQNSNIPLD
jgi:tripartite-type tricarboxylate transporter receptor subunit TctC